jgi:hypothetical protein
MKAIQKEAESLPSTNQRAKEETGFKHKSCRELGTSK